MEVSRMTVAVVFFSDRGKLFMRASKVLSLVC